MILLSTMLFEPPGAPGGMGAKVQKMNHLKARGIKKMRKRTKTLMAKDHSALRKKGDKK